MNKLIVSCVALAVVSVPWAFGANPAITDTFTADPAALVVGDTVYLYAGHDQARPGQNYTMHEWLVYSSKDMKTWTAHGSPLKPTDFSWARDEAWASQVMEKGGKYYWFVATESKARGKAIGVAVADSPTGPFKDAIGKPLVSPEMTKDRDNHGWEDIDPTVFTDGDGTTWLFWGNRTCYYAKLKATLTELDGPIQIADVPEFTEAPWVHKRGELYYLTYATGFPERIAYATASKITGPWTPRGILAEVAGNSNTIHQAIVEFNGQWYFIYHNGAMQVPNEGGSFRRSVCVDYLYYNADGSMKRVVQSTEGTDVPPQK
jgi:beta-xylosidase